LVSWLFVSWSQGLVVSYPPNTTKHIIEHASASFGAQKYEVSGYLLIAEPIGFCSPNPSFDPRNQILLILRGNCTFFTKALYAQQLGARAVIIANLLTDEASDDFIRMGISSGVDGSLITIPVVSITSSSFTMLYTQLRYTQANSTTEIMAELNPIGEVYFSPTWTYSAITTALIALMALPLMWVMIVTYFTIRKCCRDWHNRVARTQRARILPLARYSRGGGRRNRIHNERCPICLDDFEEGLNIKVLPCKHGFHSQCIDPWLNDRSDLCPICKASIISRSSMRCCECCYSCRRANGFQELNPQL